MTYYYFIVCGLSTTSTRGGKGIFPRLPIGPHTYLHMTLYFFDEMIILNVLKSSNVVRLSSLILKRF